MPRQTLEWVRKPAFCRGVQRLFIDAIEGDGVGMLSVDMLYPDPATRFSSLCRNVPTISRAEADRRFRFPWKMPFAIYEPGHLNDSTGESQPEVDSESEKAHLRASDSSMARMALQSRGRQPVAVLQSPAAASLDVFFLLPFH